jgi:circadian clock protein KaiC
MSTQIREGRPRSKPATIGPVVKTPSGIAGFDEITRGGLPSRRTTLILGGPGAGKTVLALQFLVNGATEWREPGIFVAFEENSREIVANAATFGWDLQRLQSDRLFFLDARLSPTTVTGGDFDLTGMLAGLSEKVHEIGAKRIVFDGLDVLLTLLDNPTAERREVYRLHEWLQQSGLTGIITAKASDTDRPSTERYAFMQFMVDCVISLHHRLLNRVSLRGLRVLKYRGSGFAEGEFPMVVTDSGIDVATFGLGELNHDVSEERISTGVPRLDEMVDGGYHRGSGVPISGAPGTAKTTLAAACANEACRQGLRVLFVSFDEPSRQFVRNMRSVGMRLEQHERKNLLEILSLRTESLSAEEHLILLKRRIARFRPHVLVLDPISALAKTGGQVAAAHASIRILDHARSLQITTLCTALVTGDGLEETDTQISTIADTWIHLEYLALGGERNRTLTIMKSRGTCHSNQVRELILSDHGAELTDVYTAGGQVLVGTARWEREAESRQQERARVQQARLRSRELALEHAEMEARLAALQHALELKRAELAETKTVEEARLQQSEEDRRALRRLRGGDAVVKTPQMDGRPVRGRRGK